MDGTAAPLLGEELPVELMNTVWADRDGVHDALGTPALALGWWRAVHDRLPPRPPTVDHWLREPGPDGLDAAADDLRRLRDALRRLAADTTGDDRPAGAALPDREVALAVLDRACAAAPTWSSLRWPDGESPRRVVHGDAAPGAVLVAGLAEGGAAFFAGEQASLLRACHGPGCVLYFTQQHPRREWCSAGCGNRARVARHYRRHRPSTTATREDTR
ncbi:CGNR zinc finger domain-containing protein [Actinomycetospora flava]|uniref:ABATE domain-containing protein n=1 Tax=Actinomycetospora flava TaxID=3129232 RepID=A0ABU8M8V5_9PSEU